MSLPFGCSSDDTSVNAAPPPPTVPLRYKRRDAVGPCVSRSRSPSLSLSANEPLRASSATPPRTAAPCSVKSGAGSGSALKRTASAMMFLPGAAALVSVTTASAPPVKLNAPSETQRAPLVCWLTITSVAPPEWLTV